MGTVRVLIGQKSQYIELAAECVRVECEGVPRSNIAAAVSKPLHLISLHAARQLDLLRND